MVAQQLLHPPEELSRLTVAQFLCREQLLEPALLGSCCPANQLLLDLVVWLLSWRVEDKIRGVARILQGGVQFA